MATTTSSRLIKMSPQFVVADIERSIEFYTKKLSFDVDFVTKTFMQELLKTVVPYILNQASPPLRKEKTGEIMKIWTSFFG